MEQEYTFTFSLLSSESELSKEDQFLLSKAREAAVIAYAPYSGFKVGAAARLVNGSLVSGSNQENASYPAGICAERSLLASAAQLYPDLPINTMAISYINTKGNSETPLTPCGFCRQVLAEFETRVSQPIRLIICGRIGQVYIIPKASSLLPLAFSSSNLI